MVENTAGRSCNMADTEMVGWETEVFPKRKLAIQFYSCTGITL